MRAVLLREFGPPEMLMPAEVPGPAVRPGQVLIDVQIANVTFVETQVRAGRAPNPAMLPALPAILGNGVGGTVTAAGPGTDPGLAGTRVIATTGGSGGYAERAAVAAPAVITIPGGMELADAVALLADGRTAIALMRSAAVRPGETVLVEAAAGGVGTLLVQLASGAGAQVVAAAGGPHKVAVAAGLGPRLAVDYREPDWAGRVRAGTGGVDVVFDGVGGQVAEAALGLLRPGGRLCVFGAASGTFTRISDDEAARRGVRVVRGTQVTQAELGELTRAALAEAAGGRLRPVIGQTLPLADAARAHAAIESRTTVGKTLLLV